MADSSIISSICPIITVITTLVNKEVKIWSGIPILQKYLAINESIINCEATFLIVLYVVFSLLFQIKALRQDTLRAEKEYRKLNCVVNNRTDEG